MNPQSSLAAVLDALKKGSIPVPVDNDRIQKAYTQGLGLVAYDLQQPALALYPWGETMTPLLVSTPRVGGGGDTATRWKAITGIDTTMQAPGVSEGNRGGLITTTLANVTAAYIGLGLEDSVTFESDYAAETFDDARARSVEGLLKAYMMSKERLLFGGNSSCALGTTTTATLAAILTAGALADATYSVIVVALTHDGYLRSSVATGVVQQIVRTNADGSSDTINAGAAQKSASATVAVSGGGGAGRVTASLTPIQGAVAYAWYIGTAGNEKLAQITSIASANLTALNAGGQLASALTANDRSAEGGYMYDGYLYSSALKAGTGAYYTSLANGTPGTGTGLTADGAGGIVEIDAMLKSMWDLYKLGPQEIWLSSQEATNANKKIIANGGAPLFRMVGDLQSGLTGVVGGTSTGSYWNKYTNQLIKLRVHPNAVPGTLFARSTEIPYGGSGVSTVARIKTRRETYQIEWPLRTRKYEFGVYGDEVLQVQFLPAFGAITNIANA